MYTDSVHLLPDVDCTDLDKCSPSEYIDLVRDVAALTM